MRLGLATPGCQVPVAHFDGRLRQFDSMLEISDCTRVRRPEAYDRHPTGRPTLYWLKNGQVRWGGYPVRGADADSFVYWAGGFAKDARYCYCNGSRFRDADPETFRALNYTYAADKDSVWTIGGGIKGVERSSFVVCDVGIYMIGDSMIPYGFAKDSKRVYYYDFDGKPNWVRKAVADSFVSLGDGHFGHDDERIFYGRSMLRRADRGAWHKLGGIFSTDGVRVYYGNTHLPDVDAASFEYVPNPWDSQLARDSKAYYWGATPISESHFTTFLKTGDPPGLSCPPLQQTEMDL